MLRYIAAAMALKGFSSCTTAKDLYRALGNKLGAEKRANSAMPAYYLERVNRMLRLNREYNFIKAGGKLIELGTGWLHWEALTTRLFFDIEAVLFDVWDNRQLGGLLNYISQFNAILEQSEADAAQRKQARLLINEILKVNSFEQLYSLLDFEYVINKQGSLNKLESGAFDIVVSAGVLEHIKLDKVSEYIQESSRLLKPGGYSMHSICLQDHLYQYDERVSPKQYLSFSDAAWKRWFENEVQYINRVQRSQWIKLFEHAHLELVEEEQSSMDLTGLKIDAGYQHLSQRDLASANIKFLHRKKD